MDHDLAGLERSLDALQASVERSNRQKEQWASQIFAILRGSVGHAEQRLAHITDMHTRASDNPDSCVECGCPWPCPTRIWASADRDAQYDCGPDGEEAT